MAYIVKALFFLKMKSPRRLPSLGIHRYTVEREFTIMHYIM
jgi:hypothetical protein